MYNDNPSGLNNLANGLDTPPDNSQTPYLSDFLEGLASLSKADKKLAYEAIDKWQEWLLLLPTALTKVELKKRQRLEYFLAGALSKKPSNE